MFKLKNENKKEVHLLNYQIIYLIIDQLGKKVNKEK